MQLKLEVWNAIFRVNIFLLFIGVGYYFYDSDTVLQLSEYFVTKLVGTVFVIYQLVFLAFHYFKDDEGYISRKKMTQAIIVLVFFIIVLDLISGFRTTSSIFDLMRS